MLIFTAFIQHHTGSPLQSNQAGERKKRHPNWEKEIQIITFADAMIKTQKISTRKTL